MAPTSSTTPSGNPVNSSSSTDSHQSKNDKDCMPDNPFLPNSMFESQEDKMMTHVGLFFGIICGLKLLSLLTMRVDLAPPTPIKPGCPTPPPVPSAKDTCVLKKRGFF